jgi:hypothetical protein
MEGGKSGQWAVYNGQWTENSGPFLHFISAKYFVSGELYFAANNLKQNTQT